MARSAILIEDDSGGLHMAVTDNGRCIEAASNLETAAPGRMLADLRAALAEGMDGWPDRAEDPQSLHDALMAVIEARSGGAEIVAEADGDGITVYDRDMGTAGRRYAGLPSWSRKHTPTAALLHRDGEAGGGFHRSGG